MDENLPLTALHTHYNQLLNPFSATSVEERVSDCVLDEFSEFFSPVDIS